MFLAMLLFTFLSLRKIIKQVKDCPTTQWIANYATAIQIGLIGYLVAGAFLSLAYFDLLYTFVGLTAVLQREASAYSAAKNEGTERTDTKKTDLLPSSGVQP